MARYLVGNTARVLEVWADELPSGIQPVLEPRKPLCKVCYGMRHRIEGVQCRGCRELYEPEVVEVALASSTTNWPEPLE